METSTKLSQGSTMTSDQLVIARGDGVYLWDVKGTRYLDMISQTWSLPLGHNNFHVIQAATRQLHTLSHLRTAFVTEGTLRLAGRITELAPLGLNKVGFVLHGSLAVEGAIKLALNRHSNRSKIIYLEDGFHGRSLGTMGVSWKPPYRSYETYFCNALEARKNLADIEAKMAAESPAAIIIELVQGNSGFQILPKDFVQKLRTLANQYGVTLIVDEVQTAFGCVNTPFLSEQYEIIPDIIAFGKALGGGLPIAGIVFKEEYSFKPGDHSFTFACNPVSIAAADAYINQLLPRLKLIPVVNRLMTGHLDRLVAKYSTCVRPRTIGLKAAFDIVDERGTPDPTTAQLIVKLMLKRGIIVAVSRYGGMGHAIMLQPPLIITPEQLSTAFAVMDEVLNTVFGSNGNELPPVRVCKFGGHVRGVISSAPLSGFPGLRLDWQSEFGWMPQDQRGLPDFENSSEQPSYRSFNLSRESFRSGEIIAVQYHPDTGFADGVQRTLLQVEEGWLKLLLSDRSGDGLQSVDVHQGQSAYLMAPFGVIGVAERTLIRKIVPRSIDETIILKKVSSLDALYVRAERRHVSLDEPIAAGILGHEVDRALAERRGKIRANGDPIFRYRHSSKDESDVFCVEDRVWYKFSFVSGRADYDRDIPISEVPAAESIRVVGGHRTPINRPCPFCIDEMAPDLAAEETLFSTSFANAETRYALLLNRNEYARNHICLITTSKRSQTLCRSTIRDALLYAKALGASYEGGFNSLGVATVNHFHLSFYKAKSPIWRNLRESLVYPVNVRSYGKVLVGDLSPNWTRTRIYTGSEPENLVQAIYSEIADLHRKNILHTCKFRYEEDGSFTWLTCPRTSGYMTHVKYMLEPEHFAPPPFVNTCGSVEAPGGEAIMFMPAPKVLSDSQRVRMVCRFKAAIEEGSRRDWLPAVQVKPPTIRQPHPRAMLFRREAPRFPTRPARIAHRVISRELARASAARGFDFIEIDVQMTKDNELLALWGRVSNRYDAFTLTLSQIEAITGQKPVRIEELLAAAGEGMGGCFDVKDWSDGSVGYMDAVLNRLARLIQEYGMSGRAIVESFNLKYLLRAAEVISLHGLTACTALAIPRAREPKAMFEDIGRAHKASASGVFIYADDLSRPLIDHIHNIGMAIMTHRDGLSEEFLGLVQLTAEDVSLAG